MNLARSAADEADRLCEQLFEYGLRMDLQADEARQKIEEICGGVINIPDVDTNVCEGILDPNEFSVVDEYLTDDPALSQCLPEALGGKLTREDYVSLGRPACIFQWRDTKRICACPDEDANATPPRCSQLCPIPAPAADTYDCTQLYEDKTGIPYAHWQLGMEKPEFVYVGKSLNVFQSQGEAPGIANCGKVRTLREFVASQSGPLSFQAKETMDASYQDVMASDSWWLNPRTLAQLNRSLRFDTDLLYHFTVSLGGRVLWTTKREDTQTPCPLRKPWLPENHPDNQQIFQCGEPPSSYSGMEAYLWNELDAPGYAWKRRTWGHRIRDLVETLGILAGSINNIVTSRPISLSASQVAFDFFGDPYTGLPVRKNTEHEKCSGEGCKCIDDGSIFNYDLDAHVDPFYPDIAPCRGPNFTLRYDCLADFEVPEVEKGYLFNFWNYGLPALMKGADYYGFGTRLWTLQAGEGDTCGLQDVDISWSNCGGWCLTCPCMSWYKGQIQVLVDPTKLLDAFSFACYMVREGGLRCDDFDPNRMPQIEDTDDLADLEGYIRCAANAIHQQAEMLVIPELPRSLVEGFQQSGIEGYYPGLQGQNLETILAIESNLRRFANIADNVRDALFQVALQIRRIHLHRQYYDLQQRLVELRSLRNIINLGIQAANSVFGRNPLAITQAVIGIGLEEEIGELEGQSVENREELVLSSAMGEIANSLRELRTNLMDVAATYSSIQVNLSRLDRLENQAAEAYANMLFLDTDTAGHVLVVNTVMRRRQNTVRVRYQNALRRAKKLAFIARRAIEFRLGVDMNQMHKPMTLVPPPSSWADRICELSGCDYQRIREADPDDPLVNPYAEGSDATDNYAHMYVGDYVTMLQDFVESYNIDYPFSDESDLAVISVRDDLMQARGYCDVESYNRLYFSGEVGEHGPVQEPEPGVTLVTGWTVEGCAEDDPACLIQAEHNDPASATCDAIFCFGEDPATVDATPSKAERIKDPQSGRPSQFENTGYYAQLIQANPAGHYILSWYVRKPIDVVQGVPYQVEVRDATDQIIASIPQSDLHAPPDDWEHKRLRFSLTDVRDHEIRIHPSEASDPNAWGDLWIWGVQLEWVDPWRCRNYGSDCSLVPDAELEPLPYQDVLADRRISGPYCPDYDGAAFRQQFERRCICTDNPHAVCRPEDLLADTRKCFWQYSRGLTLEEIEEGKLIPSHNISLHNFNYRHEAMAVNLVGTNVRDCLHSDSPSTCYANAFIPYTIVHHGWVDVRNHTGDTLNFYIPTARIEFGKGLAAEVLVTNPPGGTHTQLLEPYYKTGLRGRPLQGSYTIRIWDVPELNWAAVEDIQIIWKYRYWTRMYWEQ